MTKKNQKPIVVAVLSTAIVGLGGTFVWAFHSAGFLDFPWEQSSRPVVAEAPAPAAAKTTIRYLALKPGDPVPKTPVPVADQATMQSLIAAAEAHDRAKYISIGSTSAVTFIPGGTIVKVVSASDGLTQIRLNGRDNKGNDVSGQTRWTDSRFIQEMQL